MIPAFWLSFVLLAAPPVNPPPAPPPELKKLHVLLVCDTDSNLAEGLKTDRDNLRALLARNIPRALYTEKVLEGKSASRESILSACRDLRVRPDEGILFYYSGHGATSADRHFLALHSGKLSRDELVKALEGKKAGLTVVLTDCRSDNVKLPGRSAGERRPPEDRRVPTPVFRDLFFRARGLVDITSASNDRAYGDDEKGGLFTRAFCRSLEYRSVKDRKPSPARDVLARLDADKDGLVTWQEFFSALREDTTTLFKDWRDDPSIRSDTGVKDAKVQVPLAFKLGQPVTPRPLIGAVQAVVTLANETDRPLRLTHRWTGHTTWQTVMLRPGETKALAAQLRRPGDPLPVCEVQLQGSTNIARLEPAVWEGSDEPPASAGKRYNFKPKKK